MCSRCWNLVPGKGRLGELKLKGKAPACRCQKQCDRLIRGVCADCGHVQALMN